MPGYPYPRKSLHVNDVSRQNVPVEAHQERIWMLLSVAYGERISRAVLGSLRRVAKHWHARKTPLFAATQAIRFVNLTRTLRFT
jgi:hypothetical protein